MSKKRKLTRGPVFEVDDIDLKDMVREGLNYEDVANEVKAAARSISDSLKEMVSAPNELTLEFGLKVGLSGGVVVASGSAHANVNVKMTWKADDQ